jgi:hypothetical protein
MTTYEGGCLCGSARYRAEGAPINERICHCRLCQRAIGAAFNARLMFKAEQVRYEGPVTFINSSDALKRGFCRDCGTTLFSRREAQNIMAVTAGSLDQPELFRPTEHTWTSSRQPWLALNDGLPQHLEGSPT